MKETHQVFHRGEAEFDPFHVHGGKDRKSGESVESVASSLIVVERDSPGRKYKYKSGVDSLESEVGMHRKEGEIQPFKLVKI